MIVIRDTPRPTLMRDVETESLAFSQQLTNIAAGTNITDVQKRQLCATAYRMQHTNERASAIRKAAAKTWERLGWKGLNDE